jgi:hypothetical protein
MKNHGDINNTRASDGHKYSHFYILFPAVSFILKPDIPFINIAGFVAFLLLRFNRSVRFLPAKQLDLATRNIPGDTLPVV